MNFIDMDNQEKLPFGKKNYILMLAGIGLLTLGFTLMSMDNQQYGFGFLGLTLGPMVVMLGFIVEIFAILSKPE